jgi:hypothetical protein
MAEFPVPLDNLIAYVKALHPDGGPLENVSDAFVVSEALSDQADALIGYFVDQARRSGLSWSQIGGAMGVSKQAAQKRFVPPKTAGILTMSQPFSQFTPRAARALAAAGQLAAADGAAAMGVAHLAAAQLSEPHGIAAHVIWSAGISADQLFAALGTGPAEQGPSDVGSETLLDLSFDEGAKAALKGALRSALRLGHHYIGTEHLLLGVLSVDGPVAEAFAGLGLTAQRAEELIIAELSSIVAGKPST